MIHTNKSEPTICWTVLRDIQGKWIEEFDGSTDEFISSLETVKARDKKSCPLITLVDFGDKKSASGSLRNNDNVIAIHGVIGDYDNGQVKMEEAQQMLSSAGIFSILYPTPSNAPEKPRWRVIAPTSTAMPTTEHRRLTERLNTILNGVLAKESFTLSQSYYFGDVGTNNYKVIKTEGTFIDKLEPLQKLDAPKQIESIKQTGTDSFLTSSLIDDLRSALAHMPSDDRGLYIRMGHALKTIGNSGRELWISWSAKSAKFDPIQSQRDWESFNPTNTGYQSVFAEASRQGWINPLTSHSAVSGEYSLEFRDFESLRLDLLDIDNRDDAPLPHIVDRWTPENEITLLGSHGGSGKSYVALNIAIHVALGMPFGGLTTKQVNVIFYSAEDPAQVLRHRLRKLCSALNIDLKILEGKLHLLDASDIDPTLHRGKSFGTTKTETIALKHLAKYIDKHDISFCIIDNASDTFDDEE
uniref:AAA family ATPase n=1 Tax=Flavobacterium sp. TaxID=239 RepID=UPI0037C1534F